MRTKKQIVIVGAGISGLALGWYLKNRFRDEIDLKILEASQRPGGWIQTLQQNDFLFELGPRSCRPHGNGMATLGLIEELGLQEELIFASKDAYRRYLFVNQKLRSLPTGIFGLFTSSFTAPIFKALWTDWRTSKGVEKEESIAEFAYRRLGKTAAELFFEPLVSGIFGGNFHHLSMKACFPHLVEWEQHHGSLLGGALSKKSQERSDTTPYVLNAVKQGLFTLKNGMEVLIKTLAAKLKEELKLGCRATGLSFSENKSTVFWENTSSLDADHLYFAIPPKSLAELIGPHLEGIKPALQGVPSASIGIVCLGYRQNLLKQRGFGHLIPSKEKENILGMVWDSSAFPSQNRLTDETRLTVMLGEAQLPLDEEALTCIALKAVEKQLGISAIPDIVFVKIAKHAIPQYLLGHSERVKTIEEELKKLPASVTIAGNGFYGVSVNDCIAKAKSIVSLIPQRV